MVEWNRFLSTSIFLFVSTLGLCFSWEAPSGSWRDTTLIVRYFSLYSVYFLFFSLFLSFSICVPTFSFTFSMSIFIVPSLCVVKNIGESRNFYCYLLSKCFLGCVIMLHPFVLDSSLDKPIRILDIHMRTT